MFGKFHIQYWAGNHEENTHAQGKPQTILKQTGRQMVEAIMISLIITAVVIK